MFSTFSNPAQAYKSVAVDIQVESASPYRLVVMLFDGAIADVLRAREALAQGNLMEMSRSISHAIDIISNGLRASLDAERGGDLAEDLDRLYSYMCLRLQQANLRGDNGIFTEVTSLLSELKSGWEGIANDPAVVSNDGR